jgi:hypothetical protein
MAERYMTGVEMQAELLDESRRMRAVVENIRNLLVLEFVLGVLAAIIVIFLVARASR